MRWLPARGLHAAARLSLAGTHTPSSSPQIRAPARSGAEAVAAILTETYLAAWQPQLTPEAAMRFAQCDKIGDYVSAGQAGRRRSSTPAPA
ncbi:hypothetical protein ACU4GD_44905 [Cupriavidus basilensis]